jgi:uncharacterized membrane protein YoaK (UPF0700 family)
MSSVTNTCGPRSSKMSPSLCSRMSENFHVGPHHHHTKADLYISFCIGSFARQYRPRKRAWLLSTNLIQTALVLVSSLLCWTSTLANITSASALMVVALLAFAASGQTSMAVTVGLAEMSTTMVTGSIVSIRVHAVNRSSADTVIEIAMLNDPRLLHAENAARNRRLLYVASYAAGCIIGAVMSFGPTGSLFFVTALKLVISASFVLNRGRAGGRFPEAAGSGDNNYEMGTPVSKAPSSPWRD